MTAERTEAAITTSHNDKSPASVHKLLFQVASVYDIKDLVEQLNEASASDWTRASLIRQIKGPVNECRLNEEEYCYLRSLLPSRPVDYDQKFFRFIDLFAGIGGLRSGFDAIGGKCVFTSEWNHFSRRTYSANWYCEESDHQFNSDIRDITLSNRTDVSEDHAYASIDVSIPDHDVLLAGFPCQPFSIAGVSKKNSLGRKHGFECDTQGTLFFDVARIIRAKQPAIFVLENVKNLKSHDKGNTFRVIMNTLDELGYDVADSDAQSTKDPKIIDGQNFRPQHRERIVLVGFRRDLKLKHGFSLSDLSAFYPARRPTLGELLDAEVDNRYILSPKLWEYLYNYAKKHKAKGNGFGFGLVNPSNKSAVCRTLSARYNKDASEILLDRGWDMSIGEKAFNDPKNMERRPRRLTPRECARLMGFEQPGKVTFRIPVSDTQAYRQFGNSVVVDVFAAVASLLRSRIEIAVAVRLRDELEAAS
ncbi:DNA cytosine methyltransferase [Escherichia coli]|nr:DNA cytosine methyltransferase [Escherichia coli]MDD8883159.1 DNA cytosine methyltransferase [Escherichia coli]HBA4301729.1 DNA cytosine methyltransferase [Escherichia coli]